MPNPEVDRFTQDIDKNFVDIIDRLVEIIDNSGYALNISIKWKRLTFAKNNDFHHWICGIGITKKSITLTFHFGGLLKDPNKFFISGESKFLRKLVYYHLSDIDQSVIIDFIGQAINQLEYFKANWMKIQQGV